MVLNQALDRALEWPGAELGIEARVGEVSDSFVRESDLDPLCAEPPGHAIQHEPGDVHHLIMREGAEDDDLVDPVQELGPEVRA